MVSDETLTATYSFSLYNWITFTLTTGTFPFFVNTESGMEYETHLVLCLLNHGNNQNGTEGYRYISIHISLQKLEFLKIICSYARNYLTFWLVDFMNFMNFISFIIKFRKFERHNYAFGNAITKGIVVTFVMLCYVKVRMPSRRFLRHTWNTGTLC